MAFHRHNLAEVRQRSALVLRVLRVHAPPRTPRRRTQQPRWWLRRWSRTPPRAARRRGRTSRGALGARAQTTQQRGCGGTARRGRAAGSAGPASKRLCIRPLTSDEWRLVAAAQFSSVVNLRRHNTPHQEEVTVSGWSVRAAAALMASPSSGSSRDTTAPPHVSGGGPLAPSNGASPAPASLWTRHTWTGLSRRRSQLRRVVDTRWRLLSIDTRLTKRFTSTERRSCAPFSHCSARISYFCSRSLRASLKKRGRLSVTKLGRLCLTACL